MVSRRLSPDLSMLRAFECVARYESFSRAADELMLTQSAVSRQIIELEQRLGVQLFNRARRKIVLLDQGRQFLADITEVLRRTDEAMLRVRGAAHSEQNLSVAAMPTFGSRWLAPRLGGFLARHRNLHVHLGARSEQFEFARESFDLAFHFGQPVWAKATCHFLCHEIVVPAASPAFLARHPMSRIDAIASVPLLQLSRRSTWWAKWQKVYELDGDFAYQGLSFEHFNMLIEAAVAGLGVALLPTYLIERELQSNLLVLPLDAPMRTENDYHIVVPEWKAHDPLVRDFVDWALDEIVDQLPDSFPAPRGSPPPSSAD